MTPSTNRPLSIGERLAIAFILIGFAGIAAGIGAMIGSVVTMLLTIPGFGVVAGATIGAVYAVHEIRQLNLGD
jgi:uncharacterized protein YqgC (DUF456 family)